MENSLANCLGRAYIGIMGRDTVPGFGDRLKKLRLAAGLTLAELADRAGTHLTTIAKIETQDRTPTLRLALSLATALGVSVYELTGKPKGKR